MEEYCCIGRECKLGWGYNESTGQLVPINGEPLNVESEVLNEWGYTVHNQSLLDMDIDIDIENISLTDVCSLITEDTPEEDKSPESSESSNEVRFSFIN